MASWSYNQSSESNLMKVKYGKLIEKQFAKSNVLFARIKKKQDFEGTQIEFPVQRSIGGGVSSGSLPTANRNLQSKATITSKKAYASVLIDRESMKASKSDEGSFVRFTKYPVKIATESFNRNLERMFTRGALDGAGVLASGHASNSVVTGNGASGTPYIVSLNNAATYFPAHFESIEVGDILNVNSETSEVEVVDMSVTVSNGHATGTLSLVGTSARLATLATGCGTAFGASDSLYMQKSKDAEMIGLAGVLQATSGSLYGITVGRRWIAYQKAAAAALSTDLMNDMVVNIKRQCGECPKLILTSHHQYIKLLNLLEDHKRYAVPARDKKLQGQISFTALEYMSPDGAIPVMASRFIDGDKMYFINDDQIELHLRPGGIEWFEEDGTVFLRKDNLDAYEARYGTYGQLFVNPHFQGILTDLDM